MPLHDGFSARPGENRRSADDVKILNGSVAIDHGLQHYRALYLCLPRQHRIAGRYRMTHDVGSVRRELHVLRGIAGHGGGGFGSWDGRRRKINKGLWFSTWLHV